MIALLLACAPDPAPPNLILISIDGLRADRTGFGGHPSASNDRSSCVPSCPQPTTPTTGGADLASGCGGTNLACAAAAA